MASDGRLKKILDMVAVCLVIATAGVALTKMVASARTGPARPVAQERVEPPVPKSPVGTAGLWTRGDPRAPVGMIVFEDFECPACGQFTRDSLPAIEKELVLTGKLRLFYSHRPLPQHPRAIPAAAAAECAGRQGKFWEMHDLLFANQSNLDDASLQRHADAAGLDKSIFNGCLPDGRKRIVEAADASKRLEIKGTPTVFIGTFVNSDDLRVASRWTGVRKVETITKEIERLLSDNRK
jgi:protein-disulfide isomerase